VSLQRGGIESLAICPRPAPFTGHPNALYNINPVTGVADPGGHFQQHIIANSDKHPLRLRTVFTTPTAGVNAT